MSRRRTRDVHHAFVSVRLVCPVDRSHHIGRIVRQAGRDMLEVGLDRIDGPNGETKLRAVCPVCSQQGATSTPQVRWDRVLEVLDRMEQSGPPKLELSLDEIAEGAR